MDTHTILVYLLVTVFLGGGAAILMGRNFAGNWRPISNVILGAIGLALGVRWLHYVLFEESLLTGYGIIADLAIIIAMALLGFRLKRTEQMTSQYYWLYERTGPLTWREKRETADSAAK